MESKFIQKKPLRYLTDFHAMSFVAVHSLFYASRNPNMSIMVAQATLHRQQCCLIQYPNFKDAPQASDPVFVAVQDRLAWTRKKSSGASFYCQSGLVFTVSLMKTNQQQFFLFIRVSLDSLVIKSYCPARQSSHTGCESYSGIPVNPQAALGHQRIIRGHFLMRITSGACSLFPLTKSYQKIKLGAQLVNTDNQDENLIAAPWQSSLDERGPSKLVSGHRRRV